MTTTTKPFRIPTSPRRTFDGEIVLLVTLALALVPLVAFTAKVVCS